MNTCVHILSLISDIDECSSDGGDSMCFANSKCVNEDPLYSCMCLEGYEMSVLDCQGDYIN